MTTYVLFLLNAQQLSKLDKGRRVISLLLLLISYEAIEFKHIAL